MAIHVLEKDEPLVNRSPPAEPSPGKRPVTEEVQLTELLMTVMDAWQLIAGAVLASLLAGIIYVTFAAPVYRADVLLQLEDKSKGVGALAQLNTILQEVAPASAEFEILKSRMVLGAVVDNLKLDVAASPVYFPLLGRVLRRVQASADTELASPWPGFSRYAWGGESLQLARFDLPTRLEGEVFSLRATGDTGYRLYGPDGEVIGNGRVGETLTAVLKNEEKLALFVSELRSRPGTRFELTKNSRLATINNLREDLNINELGKQSGILQMSLEGNSAVRITKILNEIANIYLRQSVERKSAEAENTLSFLEKQLPVLKEQMETAEAELNKYRLKKGSVDLTKETQVTLDKMVSIDAQLTQLKREREELIRRFTPEHPRIAAIDAQIATLNDENLKVDSKVQGLPGTQQEILRLTRNMEVSTSLYTTLMNTAQELKVVKAGAVANVRIVDYAVPPIEPVKPKKAFLIVLSLLFGVLVGVGLAFVRKNMRGVIEDPDQVEKRLGLPIYATVPFSRQQVELEKASKNEYPQAAILSVDAANDLAVESLRSLRTSLYFAQLNAKNNILSITSSGPGAGKSFISVNLSAVLALAGKKILLIDADMRKGRVHQILAMAQQPGLSDMIAGEHRSTNECREFIQSCSVSNLYAITSGTPPPNPSELLMHENFPSLLDGLASQFDYVIIDSPPVLAVTDAAIIGRAAGATILVVKDGQSPLREIEQSIKRLKHAGANLRGAVYNGVKAASSRYGYGRYYGYGYYHHGTQKRG